MSRFGGWGPARTAGSHGRSWRAPAALDPINPLSQPARESKNPLSSPRASSMSAGSSNAAAPFRATKGGGGGDGGCWAWGRGLGLGLGLARGALGCGACSAFGSSAARLSASRICAISA